MNSLFGKAIMVIGTLAAGVSLVFWSIYKGWLSLEIFSSITPGQAVEYSKLAGAIMFIALLLLFVMFLARDRSND